MRRVHLEVQLQRVLRHCFYYAYRDLRNWDDGPQRKCDVERLLRWDRNRYHCRLKSSAGFFASDISGNK